MHKKENLEDKTRTKNLAQGVGGRILYMSFLRSYLAYFNKLPFAHKLKKKKSIFWIFLALAD